jgi:hypothetical protein
MANHNLPTVTSGYLNFVSELNGRLVDGAAAFDPAFVTVTNPPTNTVRFSSSARLWQRWNGSAWVALTATYAISITGNAATATAFQTARTIGGVSFNGTANISLPGVNVAGNQNTTGNAGSVTNGVYTVGDQTIGGTKTFTGAVTAPNLFGQGQSWQDVKASRALGTTYTNTTGRSISVSVSLFSSTGGMNINMTVSGVAVAEAQSSVTGERGFVSAIVPPGQGYRVSVSSGTAPLFSWSELR